MSGENLIRIQKFLSESGYCSRSQAEKYIRGGRLSVNGQKAILGDRVSEKDIITLDGQKLQLQKMPSKKVIAFNKPVGVECTLTVNPWGKTLMDFDFGSDRIFPIGRLDKETEGLLLLTNDGELGNRLARPSNKYEEEYHLAARETITSGMITRFKSGIELGDNISIPHYAEQVKDSVLKIILHEGRCKYLRKLCDAAGIKILNLQRTRVGNVILGDIKAGSWKVLNEKEFYVLKEEKPARSGRRRIVSSER